MQLSQENMKYLCSLAKIQPKEEILEKYAEQCAKIMDYMKELEEVNTDNVEPLFSPVLHTALYREDTVKEKQEKLSREDIFKNAPLTDGDYFIVPKIIEGK